MSGIFKWDSERYKFLIKIEATRNAQYFVASHGNVQPDGWIMFNDGSKFNTANNQTINPGDVILDKLNL